LYNQPDLPAVAVSDKGQIVGSISRRRLVELAADPRVRKARELAGISLSRARYFVCPKGDYQELVVFYDQTSPPTCPTHKVILREED
jgi:hypothetical protein